MKGSTARFTCISLAGIALITLALAIASRGAESSRTGIPLPTDWSHSHLIFSQPRSAEQAERMARDPRYWQQLQRQNQRLMMPVQAAGASRTVGFGLMPISPKASASGKRLHRDWAEDLGTGASVGAGNYPAKFSFDTTIANCGDSTTPDFVVYSTGLAGTGGQASIVAYDNLYSGCTGTKPSVYWAYNTSGSSSGAILTSPVLSRDGSQIAFVQTNGVGAGSLVLLKWVASNADTVGHPGTPASVGLSQYRNCPAPPCMTTITLRDAVGTGVTTDDTTSSVFYDYSNDIAWVGDSRGWLHKFTGVFLGTPAEVRITWPVQVNAGVPVSSPVYDHNAGNVLLGDAGGFLYRVSATTGAVTASAELDFGAGIVEGPIIDVANGRVYVFASSDGSGSCAGGTVDCAAVYQISATFAAGSTGSEVTVGDSTAFGVSTPNPEYIGAFDSAYFNSADATGNLYVCGNTGANPTLYQIPIVAGALPASGLGLAITTLTATSSTAVCSPVTDILNPNSSGGSTEHLFVSVQGNGRPTACAPNGCILNFVDTPWKASTAYVVGQEILDSKLRIETVITGGTSGLVSPNWGTTAGTLRTDGSVVWLNQGLLTAVPPASWLSGHTYNMGFRILDPNGKMEVVTTAGTSGGVMPSWSTTAGGTATDNGVTWTDAGSVATLALPSAGGASGVIIDNTVGSGTRPGASQVYFSTLSDQVCGTSGTGGCAMQASQSALQ